jgi:hypothetical protein
MAILRGRLPSTEPDKDELVEVPQRDGTVLMKRRGDLDFDDISARARANVNGEKPQSPSIKEQRAKRELDQHRADLERLRDWARASKIKFQPSKIMAVPADMSFIPRPLVLLNSQVWRSLGIYERRFLDALEVEHCRHAGKENGNLVLTYEQGAERGIEREYFLRTADRLVDLKLIEVTHKGQYCQAARKDPNTYRLTYLKHKLESASGAPTYVQAQHDWIDVELAILDGRRSAAKKQHRPPPKRKRAWRTPSIIDIPIINSERFAG